MIKLSKDHRDHSIKFGIGDCLIAKNSLAIKNYGALIVVGYRQNQYKMFSQVQQRYVLMGFWVANHLLEKI